MRRKLKQRFGGDTIAMFGQAFAGNINGDPLRGGIAAAEQAGEVLAEAAFQAASKSEVVPSEEFTITSVHSEIPPQVLPSKAECAQALEKAEERLVKTYGREVFNDEQLWDMQDDVETAKSQKESKAADDVQPMEGKAWWCVSTGKAPDSRLTATPYIQGGRKTCAEVKALSPHDRFMIALRSRKGMTETGLRVCAPERSVETRPAMVPGDTFSGAVSNQNLRNCADFSQFWRQCSRVSLQFRLCGGEIEMRTFVTLCG